MKPRPHQHFFARIAFQITEHVGSPISVMFHTIMFALAFTLPFFGVPFDRMLLVLTTIVSLEAIYLSIFIQMTVNRHSEQMEEVSEDIDDIQEDVKEISEDIDVIQEDVEDLSEGIITEEIEEEFSVVPQNASQEKLEKIERTLEMLLSELKTIRAKD